MKNDSMNNLEKLEAFLCDLDHQPKEETIAELQSQGIDTAAFLEKIRKLVGDGYTNQLAQKPRLDSEELSNIFNLRRIWIGLAALLIVGAGMVLLAQQKHWGLRKSSGTQISSTRPSPTNAEIPPMAINTAVMVTVELDFGPVVPSIAEALSQVERRYTPSDGRGRTFAILDAYGEPTADA